MKRLFLLVMLAMALVTAGIACQGETAPTVIEVEKIVEKTVPVEKIVEKLVPVEKIVEKAVEVEKIVPADPGSLVIYSGRKESLVGPIISQFADVTGIKVDVKYGKSAALAATLLEEGSKSPADLYYAQDPGALGTVSSMLGKLPTGTLAQIPAWAKSSNGEWIGVSGRARVLVYSPTRVPAADLPTDIYSLTDPKWKGRLGWAPTNSSLLTMITGMRKEWGDDKTKEWIKGLLANDIKIYPKNTPQVAAVDAGEIDMGLVNHYYLYRFVSEKGEDFKARNYHLPAGGPGSLVMVSGAGILKTAKNKTNAERFVNFMISKVAQQYLASQIYEYPLVDGVKASRLLTPMAEIKKPSINLSDLADLSGTSAILKELGALP